MIFWSLELLLLSAFVTLVLTVYFLLDKYRLAQLQTYGMYSQAANTFVGYSTLFLLIDSFLRIRSCAKSELAISKRQIFWHMSAFATYAIAYSLLLVIFVRKEIRGVTGKSDSTIESTEELYLLISVVVAEMPLIHILNSLVS